MFFVLGALASCGPSAVRHGAAPTVSLPATTPAPPPPTEAPASTATSVTATTTTTSTAARGAVLPAAPATSGTSAPRPTTSTTGVAATPTTVACAASLAAGLASTGSARQVITVESPAADTTVATVELWQRSGRCWTPAGGPWSGYIGYGGFSGHKREGDGTTPVGIYGIGPVMYGNAPDPGVRYAYHDLVCGDWWDEDPRSAEYNTFQHWQCGQTPPFGGGSEALWTETAAYPSFAVVDYNTDPVVAGAGSAIFVHASTGGPTAGCVSVPLQDLDRLLRWLDPGDSPAIVMGPAGEITRF